MKKIVIMSDNHGWSDHIDYILEKEKGADFYVHCGDNEGYDENLSQFQACIGNNDWYSDLPKFVKFKVDKKWCGVIHGNQFGYFDREEKMLKFMKENELDILFVGHTHMPMEYEEDGKLIINPGSTALPRGGYPASYCVLYVDGDQYKVEFKLFGEDDEEENE